MPTRKKRTKSQASAEQAIYQSLPKGKGNYAVVYENGVPVRAIGFWPVHYNKRPKYPRLKFGQFKGRPLDQVPKDYLLWLISLPDLDGCLREHVNTILNRWKTQEKDPWLKPPAKRQTKQPSKPVNRRKQRQTS